MRIVLVVLLALFSAYAPAKAFVPADIQQFKPAIPGEKPIVFKADDDPQIVTRNEEWVVVNYGKSDLCPAGGFYLVNLKRSTYQFVDAGTCSARTRVAIEVAPHKNKNINIQLLTFYVGNDIATRYPLYGY
ncbi:hypothetical protein STRATTON_108 [Erwinia phage vB_EamM_Stratton]|uniref:Uncharacterized protein n=2 Tax=Erskinevirus EaH2 TaxID=2169883 RepID=A0A1B2IH19_9CAUD|nr:hypothetical protein G173_gp014 [Erwinia phage phiEaH2]AFQ96559.1 hypothetical protein [Erwinia phage phiEaH2]ANZ50533.1 hypothetical protein STRATTON_108 [Erwinia phage vB_EamM_Stratton]